MREQLFKTRITELFDIRHPILCGGLIWLADARYVAAVVNAGGMGFITALSFPDDPEAFRNEVRKCRELTEGRPFGVCLPFTTRPGVNDRLVPYIRIIIDEGVRFIETSGASPKQFIGLLKDAGCTVIHKAPVIRHVLSAQRLGADAVTVIGGEAGGHPGPYMISTMVQSVLAAESLEVPLVIGGGMATGRHLVSALALGADGILMGSRMLAAREIWAHDQYKEKVIAATEFDNRVVMKIFRDNHRVFDNDTAKAVEELEQQGITDFEQYRPLVSGRLTRTAYQTGDTTHGLIDLGSGAAYVQRSESVEEIIDSIIDDAVATFARLEHTHSPFFLKEATTA